MSDWIKLVGEVVAWQTEYPSDADKQAQKLMEEVGELMGARLKGRSREEIASEYGDVLVVLTILGVWHDGIDPLQSALDKIAKVRARKGEIVNGIFRKVEDAPVLDRVAS